MTSFLRHRLFWVWLALVGATVLSFEMGHAVGVSDRRLAGIAILVIAFIKARYVILDFMEIRHAPVGLRAFAAVWLIVICGALACVYWYGPSSPYLRLAQDIIDGLR